jgi:hypothetical protein
LQLTKQLFGVQVLYIHQQAAVADSSMPAKASKVVEVKARAAQSAVVAAAAAVERHRADLALAI